MYPIYFEQQAPCYYRQQRRPYSMMDNYLSALFHEQQQQAALQAAYRQEQERRRRLQQQREEEEERIRRILEQRRRQEQQQQQLRAYYAAIKREQETRKRRQQQEEEERQAYHAALQQQQQQQQEQDADYLLNLLFGFPPALSPKQQQQRDVQQPKAQEDTEKDKSFETENDNKDAMTIDNFVDHIREQARHLDDDEHQANFESKKEQSPDKEEESPQEADDVTEMAMDHLDDSEHSDDEAVFEKEQPLKDTHMENDEEDKDFTKFPEEDPVKLAKYEALSQIEEELDEIRQKHEDHILHTTLDFSNVTDYTRSVSPDTLVASTAENREFLGYEDQIMKILMKLDAIDSEGDENIRNERKALVKRAENMLEKLDEFKQKEWERVSLSSHSDNDEDMN